ncbi:MAG: fasciclin [Prevotella shahii]|uniref:fasciclin n=1 Tax=Hoylesella shahii TaxID=228603 RepID=UPI001CAFBFD8|nr:fasciclin [Hoylesella shahii]MBF1569408.1 fasciclin [Hoylesella shahii]
MKRIKFLAAACLLALISVSCTQYNFDDTGEANGIHDCTMWEYFSKDPYNWQLLQEMITRAQLEDVFKGTSSYGKDITYFGATSNSIRAYLFENGMTSVEEMPVDDCKAFVLNGLLNKRMLLDDFKPGRKSSDANVLVGTGGETFDMASGKQFWIYTFNDTFGGVPGAGPKRIYVTSLDASKENAVASSNIQTLTGVVHSMDYDFRLSDF